MKERREGGKKVKKGRERGREEGSEKRRHYIIVSKCLVMVRCLRADSSVSICPGIKPDVSNSLHVLKTVEP